MEAKAKREPNAPESQAPRSLFLKAKLAAAAAPAPAQARLPGLLCGPAWLPNYARMPRLVGRNHWRMAATTCYDVLLQLEQTQSLGRRTVSTPCGLRTSGHRTGRGRGGCPRSAVAEDVADLTGPNLGPGRNSDLNVGRRGRTGRGRRNHTSTAQARPRPKPELRPQLRKWPARFCGLAGPRASSPLDVHCLSVDPAAQLHNADDGVGNPPYTRTCW